MFLGSVPLWQWEVHITDGKVQWMA